MQESALDGYKKVALFEYDFAKHGGAISAISVYGDCIPAGSIIKEGIIHVKTAATSGGSATLKIKALTTDDLLTSTAVGSLTLNALIATVPVGSAASSIYVATAITNIIFTIGAATFLTGKICVALEYVTTG